MVQSIRTNVLSHSTTFIICSDGSRSRLFLNVVAFVYFEFVVFVINAIYFWIFSCIYIYICISISAFLHFIIIILKFFSRPNTAVSYLWSSKQYVSWYLSQPRHFVFFFSPPNIIPWFYRTEHLNHNPHCQPVTHQCTTCPLTAMSLCVPEIHKCVHFRFISTGSLCRGREFYRLDMTT